MFIAPLGDIYTDTFRKQNGIAPEDYLRCLFEKAPYAESEEDWKKLLLENSILVQS